MAVVDTRKIFIGPPWWSVVQQVVFLSRLCGDIGSDDLLSFETIELDKCASLWTAA